MLKKMGLYCLTDNSEITSNAISDTPQTVSVDAIKKKQHLKWIFTFFTLFCYEFATLLALCSHVPYAPCFLSATVPHVFCALFSLALQVPCALHDLVPHVFRVLHAIVLCVPRILINHVFFFITRACLSVILVP